MKTRLLNILFAAAVVALAAAGCAKGGGEDTEKDIKVTGVELSKATLTLEIGQTETLTATVKPEDAANKAVAWSTGDAAKATVDEETGLITAVGVGDVTITVTTEDGEHTDECVVTVVPTEEMAELARFLEWADKCRAVTSGDITGEEYDFTLTHDIDLDGIDWEPIGKSANNYKATFDGGGHTIRNLTIDSDAKYVGLFGRTFDGVVADVRLEDVSVTATNAEALCGGLTGYNGGLISGCYSSGTVTGGRYVGGLVGYLYQNKSITLCGSSCSVTTDVENCYAGGLIGSCMGGVKIVGCWATGDVSATNASSDVSWAGGLVGYGTGTIRYCYATGAATNASSGGYNRYGGLLAIADLEEDDEVVYCYTTGTVFAGKDRFSPTKIANCWKGGGDAEAGVTTTGTAKATVRDAADTGLAGVSVWDGTEVVTRTFKATGVWTDEDQPQINTAYKGEQL